MIMASALSISCLVHYAYSTRNMTKTKIKSTIMMQKIELFDFLFFDSIKKGN